MFIYNYCAREKANMTSSWNKPTPICSYREILEYIHISVFSAVSASGYQNKSNFTSAKDYVLR